jgi:hypothetical protein
MIFREITIEDIPALFDVRTAVRENAFTREGLYSAGITSQPLKTCCAPAIAVGFASVIRKSSDSQWRTGKQRSFGLLPFYPSMKGGGSDRSCLTSLRLALGDRLERDMAVDFS